MDFLKVSHILYRCQISPLTLRGKATNLPKWHIFSMRCFFHIWMCQWSVFLFGSILEVLSQPLLEIVADNNLFPVNFMKLICHLQYNARAPTPPIHFYFYKNKKQVATASSEKSVTVNRTPGQYSCKARVPELGISRESEVRSFGQVTGT